jgi:hypothetical protein
MRVALLAIVVLAAAFVTYRVLGDGEFDRAFAAHRAGDCRAAVDGYARVTGFYRYTGGSNVAAARRGSAECSAFLAAERVPAKDLASVTRGYRSFLARYRSGPLTTLAKSRLATAYSSWGDQQVQQGDYDGGIGKYATAITEFAGTAGATKATSAVDKLLADARAQAGRDGTACTAVEILEALSGNQVRAKETRGPFPSAYYHCARSEFRTHDDAAAIDHLTSLIDDFRGNPLLPMARALLVDVRVDQYSAGDIEKLSAPAPMGSAGAGTVVIELQNSSPHGLEILFSGPGSKSVTVAKCTSCKVYPKDQAPAFCPDVGPKVEITLQPGSYEVVLHDPDDPGTRDGYGTWNLASGARYFNCQVLIKR